MGFKEYFREKSAAEHRKLVSVLENDQEERNPYSSALDDEDANTGIRK